AEELARPEPGDFLAPSGHAGLALHDDEELGAGAPLGDQHLPGVDPHVLRPPRNQLEVLLREGREEGDVGQMVADGIAPQPSHGGNLLRGSTTSPVWPGTGRRRPPEVTRCWFLWSRLHRLSGRKVRQQGIDGFAASLPKLT